MSDEIIDETTPATPSEETLVAVEMTQEVTPDVEVTEEETTPDVEAEETEEEVKEEEPAA